MKKAKSKYVHNETVHNLDASNEFVSFLYDIFKPESVVDIGCGLGNFLYGFKKMGVKEVMGVDGNWVNKEKLSNYLEETEYIEHNLELPLKLNKKYDLVLSLEVGEHLSPLAARTHVRNLISLGNIIVFSAAVPYQGGQNHINEQWQSYWAELFANENFVLRDMIRPSIWKNNNIPWWYRQNCLVYSHKDNYLVSNTSTNLCDIIHPELYEAKVNILKEQETKLKNLLQGKSSIFLYFKLLIKSIFNKAS